MLSQPGWRADYAARAAQNLSRWNALATADRDTVIGLIAELAGRQASTGTAYRDNSVLRP